MKLLRAATLTVADLDRSIALYRDWLDHRLIEHGALDEALAASWGAPKTAGARTAVLEPASGAEIFLRLVEQPPHPDFVPLKSYGWAAIEICVQDVLATDARLKDSPFKVIGPPREIDGLPAIYPMQVMGPDNEVVYLTQIRDDMPAFDLPRAQAPIDRMFIYVLACSDMEASQRFTVEKLGLALGRERMEIVYTMLANAFGMPHERLHAISTVIHGRDVFLELDQMPPQAGPRPQHAGMLPPGVAMASITLPDFDARTAQWADWLIAPPAYQASAVYGGKRAATFRGPDGALFEVTEA
jgi:catechol 2,3-dioxygenase-like lactoylglutathione lyase family enzyme